MTLPHAGTDDEYREALGRTDAFAAVAAELASEHASGDAQVVRLAGGSSPVLALGEGLVVKFFAPYHLEHFAAEWAALAHVHGRLGVRTPAPVAEGMRDGWGYVVMERLPGRALRDVWDDIDRDGQLRIAQQVGEATARLHALPPPDAEAVRVDWAAFTARQVEGCADRHRAKGLTEEWAAQIPAWIAAVTPTLADDAPPVLLHTELMREHVLVARAGDGWGVSGLFDFEPAMVGHRDYEMASVGIFVTEGDAALLGAFLRGYGRDPASVTPDDRRRWLAWTLLHRYGNLRWYLDRLPHDGARTLDDLAERWWAAE